MGGQHSTRERTQVGDDDVTLFRPRRLRVPARRGTTGDVGSAYPFAVPNHPSGAEGVLIGRDLVSGQGFVFDLFTAYKRGQVTNPNMMLVGEPGFRKSTLIKLMLSRAIILLGRWVLVLDPKGEYVDFAERVGLKHITLEPGGTTRLNPLDRPPAGDDLTHTQLAARRGSLVAAMVTELIRGELTPVEQHAIGVGIKHLDQRKDQATLVDLAELLRQPPSEVADQCLHDAASFGAAVRNVYFGLDRLINQDLLGMFNGPTNVDIDWDARGAVIDLSAIFNDPEALRLTLIALTSWFQTAVASRPGPLRYQVLDEAWKVLGEPHTARHLQGSWKLGRSLGLANIAVTHKLADLSAQADSGTSVAKIGGGLLADTATRVVMHQSAGELDGTATALGLTSRETLLAGALPKGRSLWHIGPDARAVIDPLLTQADLAMVDTDQRMRGDAVPVPAGV